ELLLEAGAPVPPLLGQRDLVGEIEEGARHVSSHLAPGGGDRVHQGEPTFGVAASTVLSSSAIAVRVGQTTVIPRSANSFARAGSSRRTTTLAMTYRLWRNCAT